MSSSHQSWSIDSREVAVSNSGKVFFPRSGLTKGDLLAYYRDVASLILPHLDNRVLTMQRFPDGIGEKGFFQKAASSYFPKWINRVRVPTEDGKISQVICRSAATLVYLANLGAIAFHAPLSMVDLIGKPDMLIFDLDPAKDYTDTVRQTALALRDLLGDLSLPTFVKTTGSRGFHVVVPLQRRQDFGTVKQFADGVAHMLAARQPDLLTTELRKAKRRGRIFIDTLRNNYAQTAVAPYSVRALPGAPVACPLHWHELDTAGVHPQMVTIETIAARLAQTGDPWERMRDHAVSLGAARRRLAEMPAPNGS